MIAPFRIVLARSSRRNQRSRASSICPVHSPSWASSARAVFHRPDAAPAADDPLSQARSVSPRPRASRTRPPGRPGRPLPLAPAIDQRWGPGPGAAALGGLHPGLQPGQTTGIGLQPRQFLFQQGGGLGALAGGQARHRKAWCRSPGVARPNRRDRQGADRGGRPPAAARRPDSSALPVPAIAGAGADRGAPVRHKRCAAVAGSPSCRARSATRCSWGRAQGRHSRALSCWARRSRSASARPCGWASACRMSSSRA